MTGRFFFMKTMIQRFGNCHVWAGEPRSDMGVCGSSVEDPATQSRDSVPVRRLPTTDGFHHAAKPVIRPQGTTSVRLRRST